METSPGRTGRRPGPATGTREALLDAACRAAAERGPERLTLRAVAADAGVDPALIRHYFGSRRGLVVEATRLPFDPADLVAELTAGPPEATGERVLRFFLDAWEAPERRSVLLGLIRGGLSDPSAAQVLRERLARDLLRPLAASLGSDRPAARASLVASQLVGLAVARYIVRIEPLASLDRAAVLAAVAPVLQHYLAGTVGHGDIVPSRKEEAP